jgi:hypothetical protein
MTSGRRRNSEHRCLSPRDRRDRPASARCAQYVSHAGARRSRGEPVRRMVHAGARGWVAALQAPRNCCYRHPVGVRAEVDCSYLPRPHDRRLQFRCLAELPNLEDQHGIEREGKSESILLASDHGRFTANCGHTDSNGRKSQSCQELSTNGYYGRQCEAVRRSLGRK